jgi:hypothetical protein
MDALQVSERDRLAAAILAMVNEGLAADPAQFDALALEVFAYQFANNEPYREFCQACGVSPEGLTSWEDVPAYPTDAFKNDIVTSFPLSEAALAVMTSGTTSPNQRGRIFRDEVGRELIFTANRVMTGSYLFPDFEAGRRCRLLLVTPSPEIAPSMGMTVGMEQTRTHFGTDDSMFLVGRTGVDVKALTGALEQSERTGVPIALVGATSAFVYYFQACRKKNLRFALPEGSRVCDGGGYRGRFGVVTRDDFYALAEEILSVPENRCVNTLGMGESATNYFDDSLRLSMLGESGVRRKVPPAWTRVQAVEPGTSQVLPPGEVGLLRHYDLANLPTVLGVQTDNLGYTDGRGGFEIIGRAKVVNGVMQELPDDRPVGPMGDRRVFRLLEAYVNFSIDFKMGRIASGDKKTDYLELRRAEESQRPDGIAAKDLTASCPTAVEELVAGADDPEARKRGEAAIEAFQAEAERQRAQDEPERS